jgi:N-acetylglutamate synthase-like GNAT family acetyltransferase
LGIMARTKPPRPLSGTNFRCAMTQASKAVEYRVANIADATGIFSVLQEVAPEIPVLLDTPESQEIIRSIIVECCNSGDSWVAVDTKGTVVGFVLAKPDRIERFFHKNQALSLRYIGVTRNSRRRGVFDTLMKKLTANGVPLTASVLHTNRSAMADRLEKIGFDKTEHDGKETKLKWSPVSENSKPPEAKRD